MLKKLVINKYYFLIELIFLAILTFNKSLFSHQNYQIRIVVYLFSFLYILLILKLVNFSKSQLGLTSSNFLSSIKSLLTPTVISLIILIIFRIFYPSLFGLSLHYDSISPILLRVVYYCLISVPVQELVFRAYVINRLEKFSRQNYFLIISSALIFGLAHWPFDSLALVIGTFVFGIFFGVNFLKYRNIYGPILIHSFAGLALMLCVLQ